MHCQIFVLVLVALLPVFEALILYPYGDTAGDSMGQAVDSGFNILEMGEKVKFFTHSYDKLYINTDGILSFGTEFTNNMPEKFPLSVDDAVAALFWADHDLSVQAGSGKIWFRGSNESNLLETAKNDVLNNFKDCAKGFNPSAVYVITWEDVTYEGVTKFDECLLSLDEALCTCLYIDGFSNDHCECMQERNDTDFCECYVVHECQLYCECLLKYNTSFCDCTIRELGQHDIDVCNCLKDHPDRDFEFCECYVKYHESEGFCNCFLYNKTSERLHDFCECMYFIGPLSFCECMYSIDDDFFCRNCYRGRYKFCDCHDKGFSDDICDCAADYELDIDNPGSLVFCTCIVESDDDEFCKCRFRSNHTEEFCGCLRDYGYDDSYTFCECYVQYHDEEFCSCYDKFDNKEVCQCLFSPSNNADPFFCYCLFLMNDVKYCDCFVTYNDCSLCECYADTLDFSKCNTTLSMRRFKVTRDYATKEHIRKRLVDGHISVKKLQTKKARIQSFDEDRWQTKMSVAHESEVDQQNLNKDKEIDDEEFQTVLARVLNNEREMDTENIQLSVKSTHDDPRKHSHQAGKAGTLLHNTYQAVIISNGRASFIMYNYDTITWLTGNSGGGVNGQGGTMASVGFNKRNGLHGYNHPFSMSTDLFKLVTDSNTGQPGQWMYMVSKNKELLGPECVALE